LSILSEVWPINFLRLSIVNGTSRV
jgi:hypothetical protein